MWCALGAAAVRLLRPSLAPPLKCVVVDCDYTLWHHAVGEVGAEGIVLEPHHLALQARLIALRAQGVLLCLCSKNAPQDVWAALGRSDMPLNAEHVTASRIAPSLDKPAAVVELAAELCLGEESLLFIDDNPTECAAVRAALPAVPAWCWPQQQAEARLQLEHCWPLDLSGRAAATSADASRAASYAAEAPRRALRAQAGSLATYLDALQIQISFEMAAPPLQITSPPLEITSPPLQIASPPLEVTSPPLEYPPLEGCRFKEPERLVQLRERTNQFNSWRRP